MTAVDNPCTNCGACCAAYRVDFSVYKLQSAGGGVPDGLAQNLGNGPRCAGAERTAINAPIQGTAADLIKVPLLAEMGVGKNWDEAH